MLFQKEYSFRGTHADKVNRLTSQFDSDASFKLFSRNIDVYVLAPIIGFLYGRKSPQDRKGSDTTTKIFTDQLIREETIMKYNYQLILLLDKKHEPSFDERINKAFRYYGNNSPETLTDEELYDQYVLGGIELLYEKLIENATNTEDYLNNLYDFIEEFNERYNETISDEKILDLCALARS
ncbi:hypothetical protein HII30_03865 [Paenibacillus lemnae]|uniref:Uncharacterized protein n=2 Tax=Paenibacillus lemnae TaxID=1330551 RepID=A0A848M2Y9_PAELE|nr:hypothetical protein [Paenibacillus lemnae]